MSTRKVKTWKEKLEKAMEPKLVKIPERWALRLGQGKMLVPSPMLIDRTIRRIPEGKIATVNTIRDYLADVYTADITCPLTTGIFINIAAHAAEEDRLRGNFPLTPYWRVLKEGGLLNPKFPGGVEQQAQYLKQEGLIILPRKVDTRLMVKDYDKKLADLSGLLFY